MEIRDYVSQMGWRLWLLVLLPVLAAGVAFGFLADTPRQYVASTVLTVPSSVAGGSSSGSVAQYMANFDQAIVSDPVIDGVVREVGVDDDEVLDGLDATQLGSSNLVRVSYQGPDREDAERVVRLATLRAFDRVSDIQLPFGESLNALEARLEASTEQLDEAETRLSNFLVENGLVLPREQYLMLAAEVTRLENDILRAQAEGSSTTSLEAALVERQQELADVAAKVPEYERLQAAVDRAEDDVNADEDALRLAESQLGDLEPQMTGVTSEPEGSLQTIGTGVGVAAAIAFIVGLALALVFSPVGAAQA